jgi:hypothetical protein
MRRSPSSRTFLLRLALLLTGLPLALVAFTQTAWAATVPAASPGPPFVPFSAPTGDPRAILLTGALVGVVGVAVAALMAALGDRRQSSFSSATARPALRQKATGRSVERSEGSVTPPAELGQDGPERLRRAS